MVFRPSEDIIKSLWLSYINKPLNYSKASSVHCFGGETDGSQASFTFSVIRNGCFDAARGQGLPKPFINTGLALLFIRRSAHSSRLL